MPPTPQLIINPELRDFLSPLSPKQYAKLEADILKDGCTSPLTVWDNTIVDGHNRYEICHKHGLEFQIFKKSFPTLADAKIWMWNKQDGQRNLTKFQRAETALKMKDIIASQSKKRQGKRNDLFGCNIPHNSAECCETRQIIAQIADVSHATVDRVEYILKFGDKETINALRWGEKETSINKEYKILKAKIDAQTPPKPRKTKAPPQATAEVPEKPTLFQDENSETNEAETTTSSKRSTTTRNGKQISVKPRETVTVKLKSSPKVNEKYTCDLKIAPDPDDEIFDWITDVERAELFEMRKTCPNRLVPPIQNFTIQNIPEHEPSQLINCLFSLFKVRYREKLAYGLLRRMFAEDGQELTGSIVNTLFVEFQNQ